MKKIAYSLLMLSISIAYSIFIIYRLVRDSISMVLGGYQVGVAIGIGVWIVVFLLRRYVFTAKKQFVVDFTLQTLLIIGIHSIVFMCFYMLYQGYEDWDIILSIFKSS